MRDLYNRRKRLVDWIKRVNENVDEPDRIDILKLLVKMIKDIEMTVVFLRSLRLFKT